MDEIYRMNYSDSYQEMFAIIKDKTKKNFSKPKDLDYIVRRKSKQNKKMI